MSTNDQRDPFALAGEQPLEPVQEAAARWCATVAAEPAGEDAELFALIAEERALMHAAVGYDDEENSAEAKRHYRLADALEAKILKTPARTIAGVIALLQHDHIDADELAVDCLKEIERRAILMAPIAAAPVKPGEPFGLCLLSPGIDDEWTVGHWDGEGWFSQEGFRLKPTHFALLPTLTAAGSTP
jgi:hypothetical protein